MIPIAVWLLIAVSGGSYNQGTTTTIAQLPTSEACDALKTNIEKKLRRRGVGFICVAATVAAIKETK